MLQIGLCAWEGCKWESGTIVSVYVRTCICMYGHAYTQ